MKIQPINSIEINHLNQKILKIFSILIYFLPLAIITGPFLSDLIVSLVGLYFIFISIKHKFYDYFRFKIVKIFLIFYILILFSSLISDYKLLSFESSFFYFRFLFFSLGIVFLINQNNKFFQNFRIYLFLTLLILVIDSLFQFFNGENLLGYKTINGRVSSFFEDELVLGHYLVRIFPIFIAVSIFIHQESKINNLLFVFLSTLIIISILLSGDRSAFLLLVIEIFLMTVLIKSYIRFRIIFFFFISIVLVLIFFFSETVKSRFINTTVIQMGLDKQEFNLFSKYHERMFESSLKMFIQSPILGHGPKTFRVLCSDVKYYVEGGSCSSHPHNTYMQLLAETGFLGFIIIVGVFAYILFIFLKQFYYLYITRENHILSDYSICLMISVFINLWPLVPTLNFFNNWISILYFFPVGFLLMSTKKLSNQVSQKN